MARDSPRCRRRYLAAATTTVLAVTSSLASSAPVPAAAQVLTPPAVPTLTTPVLSVRRAPAWLAGQVATGHLDQSLQQVMASPALHSSATHACLEVTQPGPAGARTLFSDQPVEELLPASNMKLLTATAVFDKLGAVARYTTPVEAQKAPVGGVVSGDLYLVGSGDPVLRTPDFVASLFYPEDVYTSLDQLARQVRSAGVTRVTGSIVADESRYDDQRSNPTWSPSYDADGDVGPLGAADVDDGYATFGGGVDVGASNPATEAAIRFTAALEAAGVAVGGDPEPGVTPAGAVPVTSIASPPMADVVGAVLRPSDDTGAELLTKELGRRFGGAGTTAAGVAVIRSDLSGDGLPVAEVTAVDGSGLSRSDRATCQILNDTLNRAGAEGTLASALPVAGKSGTLIHRMVGTPAAGRIAAKTGTLNDIAALSGFVYPLGAAPPTPLALTPPGGSSTSPPADTSSEATVTPTPLTFSLLENGIGGSTSGAAVADQIAEILASYPSAPPVAALAPLPVATP